ncbi:AVAST type 3 anti-phage proein Avs3b [Mesorhizobium sp.]|uniref:AVAST type 3 anti-phage proein Avs3b n=1 Tax=Mesorhizobium sp. TaxID=1871066 RepID=UPI0025F731AD|nr:AVAST type 3 anti-phage proein Avs3b [Mesorhizobium sp.]
MKMTTRKPRQVPDSSSSSPTVVSERSDEILALGKKFIRELKLGDTNDTLTRWMVHYLAEQIKNAEKKTAKNHAVLLENCCQTILAIWQHRHELPNGKRPFQGLEPMLRALETLDPDNGPYRYFQPPLLPENASEESKASQQWLKLAESLDYSARILVRQCLTNAADSAIDKSKEWVALAQQAGLEEFEFPILRIIIGDNDLARTRNPKDEQRKLLEDRAGKLRGFMQLATTVLKGYERQLAKKPSAKAKGTISVGKAPAVSRLAKPPTQLIVETRTGRRPRTPKK